MTEATPENAAASAPDFGPDHAAVMVMLLEDEDASVLLGRLDQHELQLLGARMCELGEIEPQAILKAIARFADVAGRPGLPATGRRERVQRLMHDAVGETKADSLMQRIAPPESSQVATALELARWLTPEVLLPLVENEHPQAIAVLLAQIDPEVAAKVLSELPDALQTQVVHRIATLGPVSPQALAMLEQTLSERIARLHGHRPHEMGGVRDAAQIMNNAAKALGNRIVPAIGKIDKKLARELENEMMRFEHLYVLEPLEMGALLREVESETLIDALKGIPEEERAHFFKAMSGRAAEGVQDEIELRGRLKRSDVEIAQREIITIAKRLANEGTISLGGGDDDYV